VVFTVEAAAVALAPNSGGGWRCMRCDMGREVGYDDANSSLPPKLD